MKNDNVATLQLLDLLRDLDCYSELGAKELSSLLQSYVVKRGISKRKVDQYLPYFPDRTYKSIYEMGLYRVLARG